MAIYRYSFGDEDVQRGVAPFLKSRCLIEPSGFVGCFNGETGTVDPNPNPLMAEGKRPFVVLGRRGHVVALTPVFSHSKPYRYQVADKVGHPGWVERSTYFDPRQIWLVRLDAMVIAADRAGDLSWPGSRNRVTSAGLTQMDRAIRASRRHANTMYQPPRAA